MNSELVDKIIKFCDENKVRYLKDENEEHHICGADIGKILDLKNIRNNLRNLKKKYFNINTISGIQKIVYIDFSEFIKILVSSRTIKSNEILKKIGIKSEESIKIIPIELVTIQFIMECFNGENMIHQYSVDNYKIDLYFPEFNLAIECDEEQNHSIKDLENDSERQIYIENKLNCIFIRYRPQKKDFNISNVINQIYKHILSFK